jgi:single-stranded-DNA-specific exonuclease
LRLGWPLDDLLPLLDLVAISTACDIVPVDGENRILLFHGLQQINTRPRPGIALMLELAGRKPPLSVSDVVFSIGPRINAAGRIEHGKHAVALLLSDTIDHAEDMAQLLETQNASRKELDRDITKQALEMIEELGVQQRKSTVLFSENWHKGVVGIVASRLTEHYYRPTIVLTESNGMAVGSARSVKGFDIHAAIEACSEHLVQFGGHMFAAGLTLEKSRIADFSKAFEAVVSSRILPEQLQPAWTIDTELDFADITPNFYNIVQQFAPFGPGNMEPLFLTRRVVDAGFSKAVGTDGSHLKLDFFQEGNRKNRMSGIAFGMGNWLEEIKAGGAVDIIYNLTQNVWNERTSLEIMVRDIKRTGDA